MPRRTRSNAEVVVRANRNARWRYVLRNPEFQRDVNLIRAGILSRTYLGQQEADRLAKHWFTRGVYVPTSVSTSSWSWQKVPPLNSASIPIYEALLDECGELWGIPEAFSACDSFSEENDWNVGRRGQRRTIEVDLDYPLDALMALIEQDLREAHASRASKRRQRPDKTDFYLAVYDDAVLGKAFRDIAATLGKPVSTVKTALLVACGHIYASPPVFSTLGSSSPNTAPAPIRPESARAFPSKSNLPIVSLDPDTHIHTCRTCLRASSAKELCSQARAYINQDARARQKAS